MTRLAWDKVGEHFFETGVDQVALFPMGTNESGVVTYGKGVAWNGVTGVTESPGGADETKVYADNIQYLGVRALETYGGTIKAYTYPDEWKQCDGSASPVTGLTVGQQRRKPFGLVYRTLVGNDVVGEDLGYILHIVFRSTASPSSRDRSTKNDSPEEVEFSWDFSSSPVAISEKGYRPTCCMELDSRTIDAAKLKAVEDALYGTESEEPKFLTPDEIITLVKNKG